MLPFNTFSIHALVGFMVTAPLSAIFLLMYWKLGRRVLVRRTDFGPPVDGPVEVKVGTATLAVPGKVGSCQILKLEPP